MATLNEKDWLQTGEFFSIAQFGDIFEVVPESTEINFDWDPGALLRFEGIEPCSCYGNRECMGKCEFHEVEKVDDNNYINIGHRQTMCMSWKNCLRGYGKEPTMNQTYLRLEKSKVLLEDEIFKI